MSAADYGIVAGIALGAWASGYVAGMMFRAVRQVCEKAFGVGSL